MNANSYNGAWYNQYTHKSGGLPSGPRTIMVSFMGNGDLPCCLVSFEYI